jgi:hypothetical protein
MRTVVTEGRQVIRALTVVLLVALGAATADAQNDPFIGVWKVNPEKSVYEAGRAPRSFVRSYEDRGGGTILLTVEGVSASGAASRLFVVYKRDGKPYPESTTGARAVRMVAVRAVDANTEEVSVSDGRVSTEPGANTLSVSRDRKTLTQTMKGIAPDGRPYTNVIVYDKQ